VPTTAGQTAKNRLSQYCCCIIYDTPHIIIEMCNKDLKYIHRLSIPDSIELDFILKLLDNDIHNLNKNRHFCSADIQQTHQNRLNIIFMKSMN